MCCKLLMPCGASIDTYRPASYSYCPQADQQEGRDKIPIKASICWSKGRVIARGGFGQVFSGLNMDTGELLAIKQVLIPEFKSFKDLERIREIEDEIAVLSRLAHPNIVRYIGTERSEDTLNIFLEYAGGGSIASLVQKYGPFPEKVVQVRCVYCSCAVSSDSNLN